MTSPWDHPRPLRPPCSFTKNNQIITNLKIKQQDLKPHSPPWCLILSSTREAPFPRGFNCTFYSSIFPYSSIHPQAPWCHCYCPNVTYIHPHPTTMPTPRPKFYISHTHIILYYIYVSHKMKNSTLIQINKLIYQINKPIYQINKMSF